MDYNQNRNQSNRYRRSNTRQQYSDSYASYEIEEQRRLEKRRRKRQEIRKKRRRRVFINRCIFGACCFLFVLGFVFLIRFAFNAISSKKDKNIASEVVEETSDSVVIDNDTVGSNDSDLIPIEDLELGTEDKRRDLSTKTYEAHITDNTITTGDDVISERSLLIDLQTGDILMQKGYKDRMSPASMTKVMTLLVACENISEENLSDKVTITQEMTGYAYQHDCSCVGFDNEESVTVKDLLYGTILPSGADAALGLAYYIAGSHEAFVDMMNEKLNALDLSSTHFTNCIGLYDDNHYSTCYDMAMIMEAAIDNDLAREVLGTRKYTTSPTSAHPDGIEISNWFLRRIEDKDTGGEILGAKTGFVAQSKSCAVSYGKDTSGNEYVVCTQGSSSSWRCIYDHVAIYKRFEGKVNHGSSESVAESEEEMAEDDSLE